MQRSIERSACEMVTVAVRRVQTGAAGHAGLMEAIDWSRIWMLPNTGGMYQRGGSHSRRATRTRTRQVGLAKRTTTSSSWR
jgi:thiazole synthase ThiGH ThiG subunit